MELNANHRLKVIKVERDSVLRDPDEDPAHRDAVLYIEFIQQRGWKDFDKLWKAVLKLNKNVDDSSNYNYLFNLLATVTAEYHNRKQLLCYDLDEQHYGHHLDDEGMGIKYQSITFEHDIGNLSKQMIKRVAYRLFYDERDVSIDVYLEFQRTVHQFVAAATVNVWGFAFDFT